MRRDDPMKRMALIAVLLLIVLVQLFQSLGSRFAVRCDKRLKK